MALTEKELQQLTKCIAPTTSIMASGIGRLFLSSPNPRANRKDPSSIFASFPYLANDVWSDTLVQGAVLLVIDRVQDAVLLQIWDLDGFQRRFEYELYYDLEYLSLDPNFHAFEMEDCVAGLCFSSKEAAKKFATKVRALRPDSSQMVAATQQKKRGLFGGVIGQDKMEISGVINVVHQQHVGMKNDGTFDMNALSPEWRQFFKAAGVKKSDLTNPEMARAVMQSIQISGFSLAAAPGKYVQASHVPPVASRPVVATTAKKEPAPKPEPQYTKKDLEKHYSVEQVEALERYKRELEEFERAKKQYEDDLAEYERQVALETWEQDNTRFLEQHETERRTSTADKFKAPPPLPPRRDKKQESSSNLLAGMDRAVSPEPLRPAESKTKPPPPARKPSAMATEPAAAPKPAPLPSRKTATAPAAPEPSPKAAAAAPPHMPPRPPELPPPPPPLPDLPGGFNPMKDLQKQLQAVRLNETPRPASRMFLAAIAASATQLKPVDMSAPPVKRTDATQTENLMQLLASTMAQRRVQLTSGDDSDDDWSD